jgi:Ca2+:H+ antiporter
MPDHHHNFDKLPRWSWAVPAIGGGLFASKYIGLFAEDFTPFVILASIFLGGAIFSAVHHAEVLAVKIGEPLGSVLLALAITVMEVAVILSVMTAGTAGSEAVARDTVFAAMMIVLNGIVGLCLVIGGIRHYEQGFRADGAAAILSVIATLATICLILPNFTLTTPGPVYAPMQLFFVGVVSLVLYVIFLFVQAVRHRDYFLAETDLAPDSPIPENARPSGRIAGISALLLTVSLVTVILLAKALTPVVELAVQNAGLPVGFVGVVIAAVILFPEALAALRAASHNRLQTSLNASLGSALACIGLTIPTVAAASLLLDKKLVLGLDPESMTLLVLTLFISSLTLATGRTTVLQGAIHLVIFCVFIVLAAVP